MFIASVLLALATCLPLAKAHGSASGAFIDDVYYPAPNPNGDSGQYTIRAVNNINPVKGADNPALNCGHNAQKAALVADARPGSILRFAWMNGELGPWVHNTGPVISYMASCGSGGCVNFDSANAQWFKVSQYGRKEDGSGWYMADITGEHNRTLPVTLPSNLPAGEYLFRHELIAMQLGMSPGGAEFYPSCMQIRLSGPEITSSELPSGNSVVTFPGGYSDSDPGITDPHVYDPGFPYTFPGPALISDTVTSEEPSEPASEVPAATTTEGTPTSSESAAPSPSSAPCNGRKAKRSTKRVVKRVFRQGPLIKKTHKRQVSKPVAQKRDEPSYPVARSRVMRGI